MKLAIVYFSQTGRTAAMVKPLTEGIHSFDSTIEVREFTVDQATKDNPENLAYLDSCSGIIVGTPDYCASECWQVKHWIDTSGLKFPGKLVGCYATCQYAVGGADVAIQNVLMQLIVKGGLAYSGGAACGQPYIHLGPICYAGHEAEDAQLFYVFGQRFAAQAGRLVL